MLIIFIRASFEASVYLNRVQVFIKKPTDFIVEVTLSLTPDCRIEKKCLSEI